MAHPFRVMSDVERLEATIIELVAAGLGRIEVYHPSHNTEQIERLMHLLKKYNLLVAGGSDFHDRESGMELGYYSPSNRIPAFIEGNIYSRSRGEYRYE